MMSKESCGKSTIKNSYWIVAPRIVLPPDLIPFLGVGDKEKEKEIIEWVDKYGDILLRAHGLEFLGKRKSWELTTCGEILFVLTLRYPSAIYFKQILSLLYPEDAMDVKKILKIKDKIFYLSPFIKSLGMIFVLQGTEVLLPEENPQKNGDSNEY